MSCALQEWMHATHSKRRPNRYTSDCAKQTAAALTRTSSSHLAIDQYIRQSVVKCSQIQRPYLAQYPFFILYKQQYYTEDNLLGSSDLIEMYIKLVAAASSVLGVPIQLKCLDDSYFGLGVGDMVKILYHGICNFISQ